MNEPRDYVWQKLSGETVFRSSRYDIDRDRLQHPLGHEVEYLVVRPHREAVGVVPVDAAGRVLLVRQWRHPVQKLLWEIPAGAIEAGESPADAAGRELREETGWEAAAVEPLAVYHPNAGSSSQTFHMFVARDLRQTGAHDPKEIYEVWWFPRAEVGRMIDTGQIADGMSLPALLLWLRSTTEPAPRPPAGGKD